MFSRTSTAACRQINAATAILVQVKEKMLASALKVHRFHYLIDIITVVVTITATVVVHRNTFQDVINPHLPSSDCIFHHHL